MGRDDKVMNLIRRLAESAETPPPGYEPTYACGNCLDRGFTLIEAKPDHHPAPVMYSRACAYCDRGRRKLEQWVRDRGGPRTVSVFKPLGDE